MQEKKRGEEKEELLPYPKKEEEIKPEPKMPDVVNLPENLASKLKCPRCGSKQIRTQIDAKLSFCNRCGKRFRINFIKDGEKDA